MGSDSVCQSHPLWPDHPEIGEEGGEEEGSFPADELEAGAHEGEEDDGGGEHDDEVAPLDALGIDRGDDGGNAGDAEDVENIGADDVADGDVGLAAQGGDDGGGEFGK